MVEAYYEARVDTFLATLDIKPEASRPFGYTQNDEEEGRKSLIEAGKKREKFSQIVNK